jgi:hypothetical protein
VFLSYHLVRTDFQDRGRQVESLGHSANDAALEDIHGTLRIYQSRRVAATEIVVRLAPSDVQSGPVSR